MPSKPFSQPARLAQNARHQLYHLPNVMLLLLQRSALPSPPEDPKPPA